MESYIKLLVIIENKKEYGFILEKIKHIPPDVSIITPDMPYPDFYELDNVIVIINHKHDKHRNNAEKIAKNVYKEIVKYNNTNDLQHYYRGEDPEEPEYGWGIFIENSRILNEVFKDNKYNQEIFDDYIVWPPPKYELISSLDIQETEIKNNIFIDGLCDERGGILLVGSSGVGKSCLVNFISHSMACQNQILFDRFKIKKPGSVLIIQSENSYQANSKRLKLLCKSRPDLAEGANKVFILNMFFENNTQISETIDNLEFQETIKNYAKEINAKMIVIDPWSSFNPGSENSNESVRQVIEGFQANVCFPTDATLLLVHHTGKSGQIRGASSLEDWAETILSIETIIQNQNKESVIKIIHSKCRNYLKQTPIYLRFTRDLDFISTNQPGTKIGAQIKTVAEILFELGGTVENQGLLKEKVMEKLKCSETYARKLISKACAEGEIFTIQNEIKGCAKSYTIFNK